MKRKQCKSGLGSIRLAKLREATAISALLFEWLKFGKGKNRLEQIKKAIRAREIIVAVDQETDQVVGFIHGAVHNDPISCGPLLYITSFYVSKRYRQKNIGSRMLQTLLQKAIAKGVTGAEVTTTQRRAVRLYKKFGFTQYRAEIGEILLGLDFKKD